MGIKESKGGGEGGECDMGYGGERGKEEVRGGVKGQGRIGEGVSWAGMRERDGG